MLSYWIPLVLAFSNVQAEPQTRLEVRGSEFVIRTKAGAERVPIVARPPKESVPEWPPNRLLFRKDDAYAVWDSRGLSVRQKSWVFTTKLPEIPTSPKIFSREEIVKTKEAIEAGTRQKEASGISGALRDGSHVYFLARWDEDGKPWLEALVQVDLVEDKPKPKLLGRFEGPSLSLQPGKSRLFIREGKPAAWVKSSEAWGLGVYDPKDAVFEFKRVGGLAERVELLDSRIGWFVEQTGHPSRILGRWDRETLSKRELVETRGTVRLLDDQTPWLAVIHEDEGSFLQNLDTGARLKLPKDPTLRRTKRGVLVWSPDRRPDSAVLYDPTRWDRIASWERP